MEANSICDGAYVQVNPDMPYEENFDMATALGPKVMQTHEYAATGANYIGQNKITQFVISLPIDEKFDNVKIPTPTEMDIQSMARKDVRGSERLPTGYLK